MCATRATASGTVKKNFWFDFEDLPGDHIGYFVRTDQANPFISADTQPVEEALAGFFRAAGLRALKAQGKPVGSTTAAMLVALLPKLVGPTISIAKFSMGWMANKAYQRRREQLPQVSITILADHMDPVRRGEVAAYDSARTIAILLPELLAHLQEAFPARQFRLKIRARGARVEHVELRLGALPLSDKNVLSILKLLDQDAPKLTIMHTKGWFGRPTVVAARWVGPPDLSRMGRVWGLGKTWGVEEP
ncbi:conserved hypothetical protein [Arthrobacter sp. 8AJ]|nr:conserved hypothetical protein [Arthrobacter sp. 8AJ]